MHCRCHQPPQHTAFIMGKKQQLSSIGNGTGLKKVVIVFPFCIVPHDRKGTREHKQEVYEPIRSPPHPSREKTKGRAEETTKKKPTVVRIPFIKRVASRYGEGVDQQTRREEKSVDKKRAESHQRKCHKPKQTTKKNQQSTEGYFAVCASEPPKVPIQHEL